MLRGILFTCLSFVALLLASCAGEGRAARPVAPGQRWEYKVVKMDESAEADLSSFLNANAADGWEYAGQLSGKSEHIVFKRPVGELGFGIRMRGAGATMRGTIEAIGTTR